jgi:hypothetical protein
VDLARPADLAPVRDLSVVDATACLGDCRVTDVCPTLGKVCNGLNGCCAPTSEICVMPHHFCGIEGATCCVGLACTGSGFCEGDM